MRHRLLLLTTLLCTMSFGVALAQEYTQTAVTVSAEKVRGRDGKVYYSHLVQEKQTLFSIAKAYGVTIDDICDANPEQDLKNQGLKKGSLILIPTESATGNVPSKDDHKVAKKGTKEIALEDIPTSDEVNKERDKRLEKTSRVSTENRQEPSEDDYTIHVVKWYESLDDIAAKYGMTTEDLMEYNGLTSKRVKNRTKLKIPRDPSNIKMPSATAPAEEKTAEEPVVVEEKKEEVDTRPVFEKKSTVDAILMLPLNAKAKPSGTNMDFYCGVLLAVKDLANVKTISTNLDVYDVAGGTIPISEEKLRKADLTIGPVSPEDLAKVLKLDSLAKTPVVSPLDPKGAKMVKNHEILVHAPAPTSAQYKDLVKWVHKDLRRNDKVIVISETSAEDASIKDMVKEFLDEEGLDYVPLNYSLLESKGIAQTMEEFMGDGVNRIIVASDREPFVCDMVRNLILANQRKDIVIYSGSKIRSFNSIEVESLHKLNLHASLSYFIDYENARVKKFLKSYRALFNSEPTQFSYQGYDVATYFISAVAEKGSKWMKKLPGAKEYEGLQCNFAFKKDGDGLVNQGIRRVIYYSDYRIVPAR